MKDHSGRMILISQSRMFNVRKSYGGRGVISRSFLSNEIHLINLIEQENVFKK